MTTAVPLGSVLTKSGNWIEIDPLNRYTELTVHLWGRGVSVRRVVEGSEIAGQRRLKVLSGDFVVSRIDARHGAFAVIPDDLDGAVVSNDFPSFQPNPEQLLPKYLGWLSRTHDFVEACHAASEGTTNRVRLKEEKFAQIEIPLPPLGEQRRIVAKVECFAAQIDEAKDLRYHSETEAAALLQASAESVFQQLQSTLSCQTLDKVCDTITDGDHFTPSFSDDGVRFIFVGNVSTGRLHFENSKKVSEAYFRELSSQRVPRRGDILYSAVGATLGVPAIVDTDESFCFQRHVAIMKPDRTRVDSRFVWHMLRSRTVFEKAWASTTGSAQPTIPLRSIRKLPLPVPSLSKQRRIVAYLDGLHAKVDRLKALQAQTRAELDALLPSILDRAFKGAL